MDSRKEEAKTPETTPESERQLLGPETEPGTPKSKESATEAVVQAPAAEVAVSPVEVESAKAQPAPAALAAAPEARPTPLRAVYEHPWAVRFCHWLNAVSIFVLVTSGLRIFRAFPSFGPKVPQKDLLDIPKALTLGGWLGGALQWHFTFMWIFAVTGILYLAFQFLSGHFKTVLFTPKDLRGVWPMVRHYFLFGPKPPVTGQYNPLQKMAYTSTVLFGALSVLTGIVLYKPVQFSWLALLMGGFHLARVWHFGAMCGFLAFIPGHLLMVALHGWNNFASMLTGWKKDPEHLME